MCQESRLRRTGRGPVWGWADVGEKAVATCSGDLSDNVVATSRVRRTWMGRALGILRR